MTRFFLNMKAFREALRSKQDSGDRCWACSSGDRRLVDFNVHKDLKTLGHSTEGCEPRVTLCPECAVDYMNSFNESLAKKEGREACRCCRWTLEKYLAFYATRPKR